jgi:hypothetical protein
VLRDPVARHEHRLRVSVLCHCDLPVTSIVEAILPLVATSAILAAWGASGT